MHPALVQHRMQMLLSREAYLTFDAAIMQVSQHLKGHKTYSLSIFLFLIYLVKTPILLAICCWSFLIENQREPCTTCLSCLLNPVAQGAEKIPDVVILYNALEFNTIIS